MTQRREDPLLQQLRNVRDRSPGRKKEREIERDQPAPATLFQIALVPPGPASVLLIKPDSYGDLVLFEPFLRQLRLAWPSTQISVLVRQSYLDATALLGSDVSWISFEGDPFRNNIDDSINDVEKLGRTVQELAPEWLIAPCFNKTWAEAAAAFYLPTARRICLGRSEFDIVTSSWLKRHDCEPNTLWGEQIEVPLEMLEIEKNTRLFQNLTGIRGSLPPPRLTVPDAAAEAAHQVLASSGLQPGEYVICAPAGLANVGIKNWPLEHYGEVLVHLCGNHHRSALIVGSTSEERQTNRLARLVESRGCVVSTWNGKPGEFATLAALVESAEFYLGNDTGALHVAAALDKPVIAIFGGGTWPRFRPAATSGLVFVHPLPCFGCGWECHLGDAPCIKLVDVASVLSAVDRWLSVPRSSRTLETVELVSLSVTVQESIRKSQSIYLDIQADREARMKQIIELTKIVSSQQKELTEIRSFQTDASKFSALAEQRLQEMLRLSAELANTISERRAIVAKYEERLKQQRSDLSAAAARNVELGQTLDRLQNRDGLGQTDAGNISPSPDHGSSRQLEIALKERIEMADTEIVTLRERCTLESQARQRTTEELAEIRGSMEAKLIESNAQRAEIERLNAELQSARDSAYADIVALRECCTLESRAREQATEELAGIRSRMQASLLEVKAHCAEIEQLNAELNAARNSVAAVTARLESALAEDSAAKDAAARNQSILDTVHRELSSVIDFPVENVAESADPDKTAELLGLVRRRREVDLELISQLQGEAGQASHNLEVLRDQHVRTARIASLAVGLLAAERAHLHVLNELLSEPVPVGVKQEIEDQNALLHIDRCENAEGQVSLKGWAFHPARDYGRASRVLLLDMSRTIFACRMGAVSRPDVAAHFSKQFPDCPWIEYSGFSCRFSSPSRLPKKIRLRFMLVEQSRVTAASPWLAIKL